MSELNDSRVTSPSFIASLRSGAEGAAWAAFVDRYAPAIFQWIQSHGLKDPDAADVTQEVMVKILCNIRKFEYDPARGKFRGWLKTIASNAARDWERSRGRYGRLLSEFAPQRIQWDGIGQVIEEEYQREILGQAEEVVRERADASTWAVYELLVKQEVSAAEVAARLNIHLGQVYIAKSRILNRLRSTVAELVELDERQE